MIDHFIVASYQGPLIENNQEAALDKIEELLVRADANAVDVLCLPEGFLQGYFEDGVMAERSAISLDEPSFQGILQRFRRYKATLIFGLNEKRADGLYNSAVVIQEGQLLGKYAKAHLELSYFKQGSDFPLFERRGVKFGVIICLDSTYLEPARILALQGVQILFCPMCNRTNLAYYEANHPKLMRQKSHFIARSSENHVWFVASDCIYPNDGARVCPGYSSIYNAEGELVASATAFQEAFLVEAIPMQSLQKRKTKRVYGDPVIAKKLVQQMQKEKTHIGAYAYIEDDGKLLLTKKQKGPYSGQWDFPGGRIEFGESPVEALRRECLEELGMDFASCRLLESLSHTHEGWFHHLGLIYRVQGVMAIKEAVAEEEYSWLPLDDLPPVTPLVQKMLKKLFY